MKTDAGAKIRFLSAAQERPILMVTAALLIFACLLFVSTLFGGAERANAIVEIQRIVLDREAGDPSTLIKPVALSVEAERALISSGPLVKEAVANANLDAGITTALASESPIDRIVAWISPSAANDHRVIDPVLTSNAGKRKFAGPNGSRKRSARHLTSIDDQRRRRHQDSQCSHDSLCRPSQPGAKTAKGGSPGLGG